ncbi:chemotaxis protein CheB [Sphingobacterium psychroaquaticum]|uniref:protein-glutamate methylesterase n=1 Tax=Sphingobacterium psychroaquaticum TaxID=561061 RepID=A0A1X7L868_9SPHI|nr:chemotaxis protein CheB [Sphingobacterium psychroaquaticum]QBQ42404.1 chemotaxis protein CheB [Sphingobacterium psychroaquaticum]SMG50038.1 two-component system, chemotaxis family, response regulator CheB [Sphingobacterium psychroaquaticum]
MPKADQIILIGGSAGSYNLIVDIIEALPLVFKPAIVVIIHRNPKYSTRIEELLSNRLNRTILQATDKEAILSNTIYFAGPGYHLLVEPDHTFSLDLSDFIQFSRPSIDVLFESAADSYGKECVGFLLSGANKDGTNGLLHIQYQGGKVYVQSPDEALIATMPESAIDVNKEATVYNNQEILSYFSRLK